MGSNEKINLKKEAKLQHTITDHSLEPALYIYPFAKFSKTIKLEIVQPADASAFKFLTIRHLLNYVCEPA